MDFVGLIVGAVEKGANAGLQATIGKTLPSEVGARFLLRSGIVVATHGGGILGAVLEARKLLADRKLARVGVPGDLPARVNEDSLCQF